MATSVAAHTFAIETFTCPLCTTTFRQGMDTSGTAHGMRLDFKQLGCIAAPWSVPVCTKCCFVLFKGAKGTYTAEEVKDLMTFVTSEAYAKLPKDAPSYQRLALLGEHLKKPVECVAYTWLEASWQAERRDAALCKLCLTNCARAYDTYLKTAKPEDEAYVTAALVRGEIHRRLGEFAEAEKWFKSLAKQKAFQSDCYPAMIAQQLKLIAAKDSKPHDFENPEDRKH